MKSFARRPSPCSENSVITQHVLLRGAFLAGATVLLLSAVGCTDREADRSRLGLAGSKLSGTIRISGSVSMAPLVSELAKEFTKLQPGVTFDVKVRDSAEGLDDVKEGKSDIGMVSRALTGEEKDWVPFVIARDGLAIAIHGDNPVTALSNEQVAGVYTKKIVNWRELGGRDAPIYTIGAPPIAGSTELFLNQFRIKKAALRTDIVIKGSANRYAALASNANAILYSSLGEGARRAAAGEKIRPLPSAGVAATSENLAAGRYTLARPLTLVTKGVPTGAAKAFIDYARSPVVIPIIDRFEFAPYRD